MLSQKSINELRSLGDRRDKIEWRIGEIALAEWNRNIAGGGKYHKFQIFTWVAREARCSKGRVEKLYNMVQFFTRDTREKYPDYKLGHFEQAMNFGPEDAPQVLDYISTYQEDVGELPKVNQVDFLYRKDVLGQEYPDKVTVDTRKINTENGIDGLTTMLINLLTSIRQLLTDKPLTDIARGKLSKGMELIEEALPELIDDKDIVNYN